MTLRKLFLAVLLLGQIVLFTANPGNRALRMDDPGPGPPCFPCAVR